MQESNLSTLFKGKRKINIDLVIKLGADFIEKLKNFQEEDEEEE